MAKTPGSSVSDNNRGPAHQFGNLLLNFLMLVMSSIIGTLALEIFFHDPFEIHNKLLLFNIFLHFSIALFLSALFKYVKRGLIAYAILIWLFGLINYLVIEFRSTPLLPWDIRSARTAINVLDNYKFQPNKNFIFATVGCALIIILAIIPGVLIKKRRRNISWRRYGIGLLLASLLLGGVLLTIRSDKIIKRLAVNTTLFNSRWMAEENGHFFNFIFCLRYLKIELPENYDATLSEELLKDSGEQISENSWPGEGAVDPELKPDIVVVMNESFADLQLLKNFDTNQDYMPFYRSFDQNVKKGTVYSSVIGGNTATAEFEFLTGMSMGFLPSGSIAYLQYMHEPLPSLVSLLEGYGYQSLAMHPYYRSGWNRVQAYEYFGFDRTKFNTDFVNQGKLRKYISDRSLYSEILMELDQTESSGPEEMGSFFTGLSALQAPQLSGEESDLAADQRGSQVNNSEQNGPGDQPKFIFTISMQNHGGYTEAFTNFAPQIEVTSQESSLALNNFLSLIQESDAALKDFIFALSKRERPTILLFFGDHQPNDFTVSPLTRGMPEDLKQLNRRKANYLLWANYDLPDELIFSPDEDYSVNYLSNLLLQSSGLQPDNWHRFLENTRKEYPVINDAYYFDREGKRTLISAEELPPVLNHYAIIQYDYLTRPAEFAVWLEEE